MEIDHTARRPTMNHGGEFPVGKIRGSSTFFREDRTTPDPKSKVIKPDTRAEHVPPSSSSVVGGRKIPATPPPVLGEGGGDGGESAPGNEENVIRFIIDSSGKGNAKAPEMFGKVCLLRMTK